MVGHDHQRGIDAQKGSNARRDISTSDRRRNEQIVDAGVCQRFGFSHLGATNTQRAGGYLAPRNRRRFVRLCMWPQQETGGFGALCHTINVALERIGINKKSWCRQLKA